MSVKQFAQASGASEETARRHLDEAVDEHLASKSKVSGQRAFLYSPIQITPASLEPNYANLVKTMEQATESRKWKGGK